MSLFNRILVVCVGNICRSPMGEYLLRQEAEKSGQRPSISSAGLAALVGKGADNTASEVMQEHGIDMSAHRARQLSEELVSSHELILVMEEWQQQEIERLYPFSRGRVYLFGKWGVGDIADPYRQPKEFFVEAYNKLQLSTQDWKNKLW